MIAPEAVRLSFFRDLRAQAVEARSFAWGDFVERIVRPSKSYPKKAHMPLVKFATFGDLRTDHGSLRHDANIEAIYGIEGDYDAGEFSLADAATRLVDAGVTCVLYTSANHSPSNPRWRVLAPCSRAYVPERRREFVGRLNRILGGVLGSESFALSQSFYIGRANTRDDGSPTDYQAQEVRGHRCIDEADDIEPHYPTAGNGEAPSAAAQALNDPVLAALREHGLFLDAVKPGTYAIRCPWKSEHTGKTTASATAYLQANFEGRQHAGFDCKHAHCQHRTLGDLLGYLGLKNGATANPRTPDNESPQPEMQGATAADVERQQWPEPLAPEAFHGIAGEVVRAMEPDTEADPAALLVHILTAFGVYVGRGPHYKVEDTEHHAIVASVFVGETAKARKGTARNRAFAPFVLLPDWKREVSGLSTGEGLINEVRDPGEGKKKQNRTGEDVVEVDPGVADKRLLVVEPEFARVLRVAQRDHNTLTAVLRELWDYGAARTMTKNNPVSTTGAHVAVIGHITADELRAELTATDIANGFANRFLFIAVKRSKLLPFGGAKADEAQTHVFANRLQDLATIARTRGRVTMTEAASTAWESVYGPLSEGASGLHGALTARAEAQVCRLALVYALLDGATQIDAAHLLAALAVWQYCDATAKFIFGSTLGDRIADEILRRLHAAGDAGLTRTEIRDAFGRNVSADRIGAALDLLRRKGRAVCETIKTDGRPSEVWKAATK